MTEEKKNAKAEAQEAAALPEGAATEDGAVEDGAVEDGRSVKLGKPLNGKTELVFDFDKIKGSTLLKCEKKTKDIDNTVVVPQLSMIFQAHVAAAALGLRYDDIINLPAQDFMAVTLKVSRFLNGAE